MKSIIIQIDRYALLNDFTGEPRTFETKYQATRYATLSEIGWQKRNWSVKEIDDA